MSLAFFVSFYSYVLLPQATHSPGGLLQKEANKAELLHCCTPRGAAESKCRVKYHFPCMREAAAVSGSVCSPYYATHKRAMVYSGANQYVRYLEKFRFSWRHNFPQDVDESGLLPDAYSKAFCRFPQIEDEESNTLDPYYLINSVRVSFQRKSNPWVKHQKLSKSVVRNSPPKCTRHRKRRTRVQEVQGERGDGKREREKKNSTIHRETGLEYCFISLKATPSPSSQPPPATKV